MQRFVVPETAPAGTCELPTLPAAITEAANCLCNTAGCDFPDAVAVALSILAGTVGPSWSTATPRGAHYPAALNVLAHMHGGSNLSAILADVCAPLNNAFGEYVDQRLIIGEKEVANIFHRARREHEENVKELERVHVPETGLGRAAAWKTRQDREEKVAKAKLERDMAAYLSRPWVMTDRIDQLASISNDSFDQGLFVHLPDAEAALRILEKGTDISRILRHGFYGTAFSLTPRVQVRPCVSNLWSTGNITQPFLDRPACQTFMVADVGDKAAGAGGASSQLWSELITAAFRARTQFSRAFIPLAPEAAGIFLTREAEWRREIAGAHPSVFPFLSHVPAQALKAGLMFTMATIVESEAWPAEVEARWLTAGFDLATYLGRKLRQRKIGVSSLEVDISHLLNRLAVNGEMTKRELIRSYHKASVSEVNCWLAEGIKRGILVVDRNLVRLTKRDVSVSACQRPKEETVYA